MSAMPHRTSPCTECPWVMTTPPGQFSAERYAAIRHTTGTENDQAPLGAPLFACHKSAEGHHVPCAGWLAAVGLESISVRVLVSQGALPASVLRPGKGWPRLFTNYEEMARHQGGQTGCAASGAIIGLQEAYVFV